MCSFQLFKTCISVNIALYAPTASNSQNISYIIVENKTILEKATKIIVEWMENNKNPLLTIGAFQGMYKIIRLPE